METLQSGAATDTSWSWGLGPDLPSGADLPDGTYTVRATADSAVASRTLSLSRVVTVDTRRPKVTKMVYRRRSGVLVVCSVEPIRMKGLLRRDGFQGWRYVPMPRGCNGTRRLPRVKFVAAVDRAGNQRGYRVRWR